MGLFLAGNPLSSRAVNWSLEVSKPEGGIRNENALVPIVFVCRALVWDCSLLQKRGQEYGFRFRHITKWAGVRRASRTGGRAKTEGEG